MENGTRELKHFQSGLRKQDELTRLLELRMLECERRLRVIEISVRADRVVPGGPGV